VFQKEITFKINVIVRYIRCFYFNIFKTEEDLEISLHEDERGMNLYY